MLQRLPAMVLNSARLRRHDWQKARRRHAHAQTQTTHTGITFHSIPPARSAVGACDRWGKDDLGVSCKSYHISHLHTLLHVARGRRPRASRGLCKKYTPVASHMPRLQSLVRPMTKLGYPLAAARVRVRNSNSRRWRRLARKRGDDHGGACVVSGTVGARPEPLTDCAGTRRV